MVDDDNVGEMWGFVQVGENMLCVSCRKNGDDYIGFYDLDKKKCVDKVGGIPLPSHGFKLSEEFLYSFGKNSFIL